MTRIRVCKKKVKQILNEARFASFYDRRHPKLPDYRLNGSSLRISALVFNSNKQAKWKLTDPTHLKLEVREQTGKSCSR